MSIANELLEREIEVLRGQLYELRTAAKTVANVRYSASEWDKLNEAIGHLIDVLQGQGVEFNNPRIG